MLQFIKIFFAVSTTFCAGFLCCALLSAGHDSDTWDEGYWAGYRNAYKAVTGKDSKNN